MKALSSILLVLSAALITNTSHAQSKADITNGTAEITWLGIDFTQTKFIGTAYQFKDAGEITSSEMRDKYIPSWNQLFLVEMKKYNVAEAVHRTEVQYLIDVTEKVNSTYKGDYFSNNPDDYNKLNEEKINKLLSTYDFKGKTGVGLVFFVDGMSKGKEETSVWVTFVNMGSKKVIFATNEKGKPAGFGFRNYWAGAFNDVLKKVKKNFKSY